MKNTGLEHELITLTPYPSLLTITEVDEVENARQLIISIQNLHESNYVYLGSSSVSESSFGYMLDPGQIFTADLKTNEELYGIGDGQVAVIRLIRNG
mgnify:CR=1 FL=1